MTKAVSYKDGIGRKELQTVRRRFLGIHRERLHRITEELRPSQRVFIELLPLLFHINHPILPGFTGTTTPVGIPDYAPTQPVLRAARKLSKSFAYKKRARRRYRIHGIYLMGSIGSIAHTTGSDLDVWLCHDPELSPRDQEKLKEKARKIEQWASELNLEAHIFVMDADSFRRGQLDTLSHESSGSTQPHLLLEEFYRTGVLLAGRYPIWWLVPPEEESNYSNYVEMLVRKRFVDPLDCLDFGGLEKLPAGEFLGAAHWQLYKGIESPYKAILKLLLTEAYAQNYPKIHWLCQEAKSAVYDGRIKMNELDPYLLMYRRVELYLKQRVEPKRLELARRCFYFKTEQTLSSDHPDHQQRWKQELLQELVKEWGWNNSTLRFLDSRQHWKIDRVMEERNILVRELTHSYRLLTDFSRDYADNKTINPEELSLLGRKLYTVLEKRPGKIDSINPGIANNLIESRLSLHYAQTRDDNRAWFLFLGQVDEESALVTSPLKTTQGLTEMLTWCQHNRLLDQTTIVSLYPKDNPVSRDELHALLNVLRNHYVSPDELDVPMGQLAAPPYVISCALFINTGIDPMAHLAKLGKQLTSDRSDPLSFASAHTSLVESVEQLITTSWGETLILRHWGTSGLLDSLCHFLRLAQQAPETEPVPTVTAHSFSSVRGSSMAKRVEQLFNDVSHSFSTDGAGPDSRYLLQADDQHYLIQQQEERFSFFPVDSWDELLEVLAQPQSRYRTVTIDRIALGDTPLPVIFRANHRGVIQVFYHTDMNQTELFILDEFGSLFHQRLNGTDEHYLLVQQQRFLNGLRLLRSLLADGPTQRLLLDAPEFYRLSRSLDGEYLIEPRTPPRHRLTESYLELRLISDGLDLNQSPHLLVCGDHEFSSIEHGDSIYTAVAEYVLSRRKSSQTYPIYLTGLELSGAATEGNWPTIKLLNFKKRLESRLNQALRQLV